jgi:hypothetical protein
MKTGELKHSAGELNLIGIKSKARTIGIKQGNSCNRRVLVINKHLYVKIAKQIEINFKLIIPD